MFDPTGQENFILYCDLQYFIFRFSCLHGVIKQYCFALTPVVFLYLQSLMLQIAATWLEQEATEMAAAKETYMEENCPAPDLSTDMAALAVTGLNHNRIKTLLTFSQI